MAIGRGALRRISRSVVALALARGTVVLLSLAIAVLLANRLGAGVSTDAFFLVRRLTVGLSEAFGRLVTVIYVPPLVAVMRSLGRGATGRLWWSHMIRIVGLALLGAAIVAVLAPWVVAVFAPGFDAERAALATRLLQILVFMIPAGLALASMRSLLFASRRFGVPEFAKAFPRFLVVMILILLVPPLGVTALSWALLGGTVLVILVLVPSLLSVASRTRNEEDAEPSDAMRASPDANLSESPGLGVPGRTLPALLLLASAQSAAWIDVAFASTQPLGGVSVLEYGYRIVNVLPDALMFSLNAVMYTEFAHMTAEGSAQATTRGIARYLRAGLFLLLPFVAFVWVAADAIVGLLFGHGAFSDKAVQVTVLVIRLNVPSILFTFLRTSMMARLFAEKGAPYLKIAGMVACVALISRAGGAALLVTPLGVPGIALAGTLSGGLVFVTLYFFLTRHWGKFILAKDVWAIARMVASTAVSAGAMYGLLLLTGSVGGLVGEAVALASVGVVGAISYLGTAALLRIEELSVVGAFLRRRGPSQST